MRLLMPTRAMNLREVDLKMIAIRCASRVRICRVCGCAGVRARSDSCACDYGSDRGGDGVAVAGRVTTPADHQLVLTVLTCIQARFIGTRSSPASNRYIPRRTPIH